MRASLISLFFFLLSTAGPPRAWAQAADGKGQRGRLEIIDQQFDDLPGEVREKYKGFLGEIQQIRDRGERREARREAFRMGAAAERIAELNKIQPPTPEIEGQIEREFQEVKGAIRKMDPPVFEAFLKHLGDTFQRLGGELEQRFARSAKEAHPTRNVFKYAARVGLRWKDWDGAKADANEALKQQPKDPEALTTRAGARYELGDYRGAYQDAQLALQLDPSNPVARAIANSTAGRSGPPTGLETIAAASPTEGPFQARGGGPAGAETASSQAAASPAASAAPGSSPAAASQVEGLLRQAGAAIALRDMASAEKLLDKAIEADPGSAQAYVHRAGVHIKSGNSAAALIDAGRALELRPNDAAAANARILALNRLGRHAEAESSALDLLRRDNANAQAWYNLAYARDGLSDRGGALRALREAARYDPAQFGRRYQEAAAAPESADISYLFADSGARPAPQPAPAKPAPRSGSSLVVVVSTLVGGFLVALGLLHSVAPRGTGVWTRRASAAREEPPSAAPAPARAAGKNVIGGNYEVLRQIGLGGMGIVYEALDRTLERRVAVKKMREEIRIDPRERERFLKEARTVAKLHHPNIVEIHSIVEDGDDVFLIFEYVNGGTLYELLDRRGTLPLPEAAALLRKVCDALEYAHKQDIIHRDLKPSNIMIGEGGEVKVMDFGVARQAKDAVSKLSMTNTIVGTPPYMAPEQEQGLVCKESDIFALGVCFYEMLTGRMPFQGTGAGLLLNKMNRAFVPPSTLAPGLPPAVDALLSKALEPDPAKRLRSVAEFVRGLEAAV